MLRASDNAEPETEPGETGVALIAARPGRMRESLQALLAAMPRTSVVRVTGDGAAPLATARMTAFRPGQSPPPVSTPMRLSLDAMTFSKQRARL